jgi:hypothetical protein
MDAERATQYEIPTPHSDELPGLSRRGDVRRLNPHELYAGDDFYITSYRAQRLYHVRTQTISKFKDKKAK